MKIRLIKSLMTVLVLALVLLMPVAAFAESDSAETVVSMPVPDRYASGVETAAQYSLEAYVDVEAFGNYLYGQLKNCASSIDISAYNIPNQSGIVTEMTYYVLQNIPEAFHFYYFSYYYYDNGIVTELVPTYFDFADTVAEYDACSNRFEAVVDRMVDGIEGNTWLSDAEKALLLHDRLVVWTEYDYANYLNDTIPNISYTAYGILVDQVGVCQGYALAYDYLLEQVGIRSEYVSSELLNHAWNIVYINNKPYHVDTTWDDPTWDITGKVNHDNFLRSSNGIKATGHEVNGVVDYNTIPTDTTYDNYYWQNSNTAFQLVDGWIFFIDNAAKAMKYLDNGTPTTLFSIDSTWYATGNRYWTSNYSKLSSDSDTLLFSQADGIYRYNPHTGAVDKIYSPNLSVGDTFSVFGFKYEGGYLICDLNNTPSSSQPTKDHQVKQFYDKEPPEAEFLITTDPATTQTLTIDMKDNAGVTGYYFGTDPDCGDNHYVVVGGSIVTETISNSGVYYVWVKDDGGNLSERYAITIYKISFDANGGSVTPAYTLGAYSTTITLPTPTRAGYKFKGWSTSKTAASGQTTLRPEANVTYYAVWEKLQLTGWQKIDGKWYYYSNYMPKTGWLQDGKLWYYFDANGVMQTGWVNAGGVWYYMNSSGAMVTGWVQSGGVWYYMNSSGAMVTGWLKSGSTWYYFNSSGAMVTGWLKNGSTYYYFNASGAMVTGWVQSGGVWYYMNSSGAMVTGWLKLGGQWYYFSSSGAMYTGWLQLGGKWYAFTNAGNMIIGWGYDASGNYYYFNSDGSMVTGQRYIDGKWYTFSSSGVCQNP